MPKTIILYPKVEIFCVELNEMFSCTKDPSNDNKYFTSVYLPQNDSDTDMIYNFEAYSNEVATGLTVQVIVGCETIYDYYNIHCIHVDNEYLEHHGGEVTFTISFEDCTIGKCPCIKLINLPSIGTITRFISSKGQIYISGSVANSGIFYYDCKSNAFIQISNVLGSHWNYFFEDSKGNVYVNSALSTQAGIWHLDNDIASFVTCALYNTSNYFEDSNGNVYLGSGFSGAPGIYHLNGKNPVTQIVNDMQSWDRFCENNSGDVYVSSTASATTKIYLLKGTASGVLLATNSGFGPWTNLFKSSNNEVFVSNATTYKFNGSTVTSLGAGKHDGFFETRSGTIYAFKNQHMCCYNGNNSFIQINNSSNIYASNMIYYMEDINGNVYCYRCNGNWMETPLDYNNYPTLFVLNGQNPITVLSTTGFNDVFSTPFFKDDSDNIYITFSSYNWKLNGTSTPINVPFSMYGIKSFITSKGVQYILSTQSTRGVFEVNGNTITQITSSAMNQSLIMFEDIKRENVFIGITNNYLLRITGTTAVQASDVNIYPYEFKEVNNKYIIAQISGHEYIWNESTLKFEIDLTSESYYRTPLGKMTWNNPGSGVSTLIFYNKKLLLESNTRFFSPMIMNDVVSAINHASTPTQMLIIH